MAATLAKSGASAQKRNLQVERLGRVPYGPMLALQEARHADVAAGVCQDTLFLLEHDPVITTGRNTGASHVLASRATLAARQVDYFETGRGGDVTYHGPGQLVGYPILQLEPHEQDIRAYVHRLEEILIRTAADFDVVAERVAGLRGIWVGNDKLAAIGVRIARWTTCHGFALNVSTRLEDFDLIVPCGLYDRGVTSLEKLLGAPMPMATVHERIVHHAAEILQRTAVACEASPWDAPRPTNAGSHARVLPGTPDPTNAHASGGQHG